MIVPFLGTLAVGLGLCTPPQAPGPYDDTNTGSPEEARALIEAMAVNDAALWAMEWEQRTFRWNGTAWEPAEESRQAFDGPRWSMVQTVHMSDMDSPMSHIRRFDGFQCLTLNADSKRGSIRPVDVADRGSWGSPLKFLGRFLDRMDQRTLAQILADGQDLRVRSEAPTIRVVSGYAEVSRRAYFVEAALDTARGFCPVRIRVFDGLLRWPIAQLESTRLERHGDVWIPMDGIESHWYLPATEEPEAKWMEFQRRVAPLSAGGAIRNPADPAVRLAYKEAIQAVYGAAGIPVATMVPPHRLEVTKIHSVNRPIPLDRFSTEPPDDTELLVDGLRLRASGGAEVLITP